MKSVIALPCSPFDRLRVNGERIEIVEHVPFVLSLSKYERNISFRKPIIEGTQTHRFDCRFDGPERGDHHHCQIL